MTTKTSDIPVVILCGGRGTRFREKTEFLPKPMIEVAGRPILWHIMSFYAGHGFKKFVLCLGYKADVIKRYFLDYAALERDFTVDLSHPEKLQFHGADAQRDWTVTCVDTGLDAMTGARLFRVGKYLTADTFLLTYGDGLSDVDVPASVAFHRQHGKVATVTGVRPQSRFGELIVDGNKVQKFSEKPNVEQGFINGGFFVFSRKMLDYVRDDDGCILERDPLERVAADGQLMIHEHHGFWQCMDTYRDLERLEAEWNGGKAPWVNWK
ncbi:MAG TPA: glucose-1-phosphate cytidylyltransferase [Kofleriaceae bacterium]|nr:glucose-1-phosphate cytidylyltransferase [Kofleriaceae bacterium]